MSGKLLNIDELMESYGDILLEFDGNKNRFLLYCTEIDNLRSLYAYTDSIADKERHLKNGKGDSVKLRDLDIHLAFMVDKEKEVVSVFDSNVGYKFKKIKPEKNI